MYEKYPYLCITSLCIALIACYFSPRDTLKVNVPLVSASSYKTPPKEAKQILLESFLSGTVDNGRTGTNTGGTSSKSTGTGQLQSIYDNSSCNADCKVKYLIKLGMNQKIAGSLVYTCKDKANDPRHCIIVASSILKSESNLGKKCNGYNCFGMGGGRLKYKSYEDSVEDFVQRYNKYWYKAKSASYFYPPKGGVSYSRYCTSEASSNSSKGCPNGLLHSQNMWRLLSTVF